MRELKKREIICHLYSLRPAIQLEVGKKKKNKNFDMHLQLCSETHRYVLFNTGDEQVENIIKEHKSLIDNHSRSNAWVRVQSHSQEFADWFKKKVKTIEVPNHLIQLAKGPNTAAKRYTAYFINGYQFHTMKRDSRCKTQNYGVTLSATTDSFASARGQNPIDGEVVYYGSIKDIIEIDYWICFSVVLFECDWFHNEIDEYGLTRVYFNKLCSTEDPFVLASQVHQVFMWRIQLRKMFIMQGTKSPLICMIWRKRIALILKTHFGGSPMITLVHQIDYPMLISYGQEKTYLVMSLICHLMYKIQKIWKHQKKRMTLMIPIGIGWWLMIEEGTFQLFFLNIYKYGNFRIFLCYIFFFVPSF
ncbi:uncharacterized protein LOC132605955 [Lycium barbarum]|uniref:uncharacterized protein LOC132605955 n=1 Tax=Lycium barbarum TaxID=112863 RepID=UPI00293E7FC1|nr:uncharacterized protein LOC132605955 [Lycium barbarum]